MFLCVPYSFDLPLHFIYITGITSNPQTHKVHTMAKQLDPNKKEPIEGIVTARKCDCCGHHEIGVTTKTGKYVSLKPGMKVKIINGEGNYNVSKS